MIFGRIDVNVNYTNATPKCTYVVTYYTHMLNKESVCEARSHSVIMATIWSSETNFANPKKIIFQG